VSNVADGGAPGDLQGEIYEVFRQERDGSPMQHAGNLRAPDPELADHYAREFYSRRQESVRLWVVKRSAIREVDDPDLLRPPLDRSFKKPPGYSGEIKRKLAEARELAGQRAAEEREPAR
jgi:ring-1,2-phenylacetyl-CoA epoxidase subunit PaaB